MKTHCAILALGRGESRRILDDMQLEARRSPPPTKEHLHDRTEELRLEAPDGYPLAARLYHPEARARATVVVLGGTGIPQRYYRRFAQALTRHDLEVLTVDYRGIGASRPKRMRNFDCTYRHWLHQDVPAAVAHAHARGPVVVVGHSFGGHAFGLLPDPNRALGLYAVATGAGWSGYMPWTERVKVEALWNVVGPLATRTQGYLPGPLWGGVDLPRGVYADWRRWSRGPTYFFGAEGEGEAYTAAFARVTVPVKGVTASDDRWAPKRSMEAFLGHYTRAPMELEIHTPAELGVQRLGHLGHFAPGALGVFVPRVASWVEGRLAGAELEA